MIASILQYIFLHLAPHSSELRISISGNVAEIIIDLRQNELMAIYISEFPVTDTTKLIGEKCLSNIAELESRLFYWECTLDKCPGVYEKVRGEFEFIR